ncbi:DUF2637 domain-containing protein [Streptomyces sp. NPDC051561]|uniref:DUF2637 domain-containing protein n=1 Tax=Streptomyces sp. NPDC051561 TaxID=3365658 RepID=UPI003797B6E3
MSYASSTTTGHLPVRDDQVMTGWDVTAIVLLGAAGFVFSYDALRQIAVAIHARESLSYLFPVFVDGFIAYGVRAIVVLLNRPFGARLYAWTLFLLATGASLWANSLHAITLNRSVPSGRSALRLDDSVVGILSMLAPLALAGAVHLYILMTRTRRTVLPIPPSARPGLVPDGEKASAVSLEKAVRLSPPSGRQGTEDGLIQGAVTGPGSAVGDSFAGPGRGSESSSEAVAEHPADRESGLPGGAGHEFVPTSNDGNGNGTEEDQSVPDGIKEPSSVREDSGTNPDDATQQQTPEADVTPVSAAGRKAPHIASDELRRMLPLARAAVTAHGRITRDEVAAAVRAQYRISNDRVSDLLAILREEAEFQAQEPASSSRAL